jgi:hypothetical protein
MKDGSTVRTSEEDDNREMPAPKARMLQDARDTDARDTIDNSILLRTPGGVSAEINILFVSIPHKGIHHSNLKSQKPCFQSNFLLDSIPHRKQFRSMSERILISEIHEETNLELYSMRFSEAICQRNKTNETYSLA